MKDTDQVQDQPAPNTNISKAGSAQGEQVDLQLQEVLQLLREANKDYANGELEQAEKTLRKALVIKPQMPDVLFSLGVLLREAQRWDESKKAFQEIIAIQPRAALSWNNLGLIASREHDLDEAERCYRQAIEDHFQLGMAHLSLGFVLLQQGRFAEGWRECEWRWETSEFTPLRCLQPRWGGEKLNGTLLVYTEQGAGDVFQFCRFMPQIRERVGRLLFVCPDNLRCMFEVPEWADEILPPGDLAIDAFVAHLPLMSAPYALKLTKEDEHRVAGCYLTPEPRTVNLGESHVPAARLKVGLSWAGSPTHKNDAHRSFHAAKLARLLEVNDVAFYSLQKGPQVAQLAELPGDRSALRDLDALQNDFADTAAIIQQLDLVICVDTSILHLSGGLNVPVWGLLSDSCDWRWGQDREDSFWYSSLRLFRQRKLDDWDEVIERVAGHLHDIVSGKSSLT